jgi:GT2 family glycosyltransferase
MDRPGLEIDKVAIVILTWNRREETLRCLSSLISANYKPEQIIVWDNGSEDGTKEAIGKLFPTINCHYHPTNLGVASGRNAASQLARKVLDPDFLLFLDNDTEVTHGFLEKLIEPFRHDESLAQTTGKIRFSDDRKRLNSAGGIKVRFFTGKIEAVGYGEIDKGQYDIPGFCLPAGGATLVKTEVFFSLGGFDPAFDPYGPEDLDFALRVRQSGHHALYIPDALVYHERERFIDAGTITEEFAGKKVQHWMILIGKHATPIQRLGFYSCGLTMALFRIVFRVIFSGNTAPLKGMICGFKKTIIDKNFQH